MNQLGSSMSVKTLMTAAEFANSGPETDGFELVRGELVAMPPAKKRHGEVRVNVSSLLRDYKRKINCGRVYGNDTSIITGPATVRGVDVAFSLSAVNDAGESYITTPPDLTVEVRSEGQAWKDLVEKVHEYLHMGVRMVWIVDPSVQRLTVFDVNPEPATYAAENDFDGGDVLPGLRFKVAEIFE